MTDRTVEIYQHELPEEIWGITQSSMLYSTRNGIFIRIFGLHPDVEDYDLNERILGSAAEAKKDVLRILKNIAWEIHCRFKS